MRSLLSSDSSRRNKIACCIAWGLQWRWAGEPYKSRMMIQLLPDGPFQIAKSYDEDVWPLLKFGKDK